ncbi:MAG: AMP-binding protein, partial [Gammaproteobacteria bacterium]|nr:AMP-binding protein [Gammaproteobacteria bacterium]
MNIRRNMEIPNHNATLPAMLGHLSDVHGNQVLASDSRRSLTYRQAEEESRELALGLLASSVGKGTRVGLLMANSPDWIVAWFAALRVGALVTGVSTFCKPPELARVLKLADIDTLLMQDNYLRHNYVQNMERALPGLASVRGGPLRLTGAPYLRSVWVWGGAKPDWARGNPEDLRALGREASGLSAEFLAEAEAQVSPADLAVVIFTSGSTAQPKGVIHSHGTVVRHAYTMYDYAECAPGTRILVLTPFFWIGGMLTTLLNTMIGGAELICPERPDPEFILELLRRGGAPPHHPPRRGEAAPHKKPRIRAGGRERPQ